MKRILVLGPPRAGRPSPEQAQVEVHHAAQTAESAATAAGCSSVIVINDASSASIQRLLLALRLWRERRQLRIGVLSYLDDAELRQAISGDGLAAGPAALRADDPLPVLLAREPGLKIGLHRGVLSVEYQAV
jgi:hypothetical protein